MWHDDGPPADPGTVAASSMPVRRELAAGGNRSPGGPSKNAARPRLLRRTLPADRQLPWARPPACFQFGLGILWHTPVIFTAIALLVAIPAVIALARRTIAFRADHAGITLSPVPDKLTFRRGQAVFVPWSDAGQIILYPAYP
jgi:hypothetical protein